MTLKATNNIPTTAASGPTRRPDSKVWQYKRRIPADVLGMMRGITLTVPLGPSPKPLKIGPDETFVRMSLGTTDYGEASARWRIVDAYVQDVWRTLRKADKPVSLTHRQAVALAGELYRAYADPEKWKPALIMDFDRYDGTVYSTVRPDIKTTPPGTLLQTGDMATAIAQFEDPKHPLRPNLESIMGGLLFKRGIANPDPGTREMLTEAFFQAALDGLKALGQKGSGDYSDDPAARRYPAWSGAKHHGTDLATEAATISGILEGWWREARAAGRASRTYVGYRNVVNALIDFLGHDSAIAVTAEDARRFKAHRIERGIAASTLRVNLRALTSIFGWAYSNGITGTNPFRGVSVVAGRVLRVRERGFTDDEARRVLQAAIGSGRADRKWLTLLAAYHGARIGELIQLRKADVFEGPNKVGWCLRITPEAGTVKTHEARTIPMHPRLVALGFPEWAHSAEPPGKRGYLFIAGKDPVREIGSVTAAMSRWARKLVTDRGVPPNNGWRHRFKTLGRRAALPDRTLDAIQGHAPRTQGETYGHVPLEAMAEAIAKIPLME